MALCTCCSRSGVFLRTDDHGICKKCKGEIRPKVDAEKEIIKRSLIYAQFIEDREQRIRHLRSALESAKQLFKYERMGFRSQNPSPRTLKASIEAKLEEAMADLQEDRRGSTLSSEFHAEPGAGGRGKGSGTRRFPRHPAVFGVWMDSSIPARTEDVSARGLCVRSTEFLRPGTRIGVMLEAPEGLVSGEGMVRWAQRSDEDEHGAEKAVMGLEFLTAPPELERFNRLPPPEGVV